MASSVSDGRKEKSAAAFRTISEVAKELDLPQHVLRFWETKFQVIKPMKRGGGRRYYRPEDVDLLRRIRSLLYVEGYTIKGVQKLLRGNGSKNVPESDMETPAQPVAFADDDRHMKLKLILDDLQDIQKSLKIS